MFAGFAWWAAVHGVTESLTQLKQLSVHECIGEGNGNPLQYSCLENPRDRGAWWAAIYGVTQSPTRLKQLSVHECIGERNGNPFQYSCLENPRDRGAWWASICGVTQSRTWLKQLSSGSSSKELDTTKHAAAHALQGRTNSGKFSIQFSLESHCILIMKYSTVTLRKHI